MTLIKNSRRRNVLLPFLTFLAGTVVAGWFWREQVLGLASNVSSYVRRRSEVKSPALIINRWSGDGKAERLHLADKADELGIRTIMLERGDDLEQLAHDAISAGADAIGMAGGDGSLGLVAAVAAERDVPFFCVPVGTRNHFALDLGLDRDDPLTALEAISDGEEVLIDVGVIGDRVFVNNVSLGVYAVAVHQEGYRESKEETLVAAVSASALHAENQPSLQFATPDGSRHDKSPLVMISNNKYTWSGPPDFGRRTRLDTGRLGVGVVTNSTYVDGAETASLGSGRNLHEWETGSFRIASDDETIKTAVDGEALEFAAPLSISSRPRGLRVLVPAGTRPGYLPPGQVIAAKLLDLAAVGGNVEVDVTGA